MHPKRKPPANVLSVAGTFEPDRLTDEDYEHAVDLQAGTLKAQKAEREALLQIRERLRAGALDSGVKYFFDFELGIVRRRGRGTASRG